MSIEHSMVLWIVSAVVIAAALIDLRTYRIPNWLVLPFLAGGLIFSGVASGVRGLEHSLLGILTGAIALGLFCYLGAMGMGDLKLCAAIGAWLGASQLIVALVFMGLAGGVIAIGYSLAGGYLSQTFRGMGSLIAGFARTGLKPHQTLTIDNPLAHRIPYAPAIAIGTLLTIFGKH